MNGLLAEIPNGAWVALGTAMGAIISYISAKSSAGAQIFSAEIRADKDLQIHQVKIHEKTEQWRRERMLDRLECAHQILCEISMSFSQTEMYFTDEDRVSVEEFREWYRGYCLKFHKSLSYVSFYMEDEADVMQEIYGHMNVYWGEMEGVLMAHKEGKIDIKRTRMERALISSNEIGVKSARVRSRIERFANGAASPMRR